MRIIDIHSHIYPEKIAARAVKSISDFYDLPLEDNHGTAEHLLRLAEENGVERIFICSVATKKEQVRAINTFLLKKAEEYPRFLPIVTLHPSMTGREIDEELSNFPRGKVFGIKLHPDFQTFDLAGEDAFKLFERLDGTLPVLTHTGDSRYNFSHPEKMMLASRVFPHIRFIAAHFGGYSEWEHIEGYRNCENVFFDTSSTLKFLSVEQARHFLYELGIDRFMFGSDFPMWRYDKELLRIKELNLPQKELEDILFNNAKKFFKLS